MVNPYRFYTYAYLREDRTPYYIGKGEGKRIYKKGKGEINPPKDKSRVIFLKQNLTEEEAFKHEIYMIDAFGRKDLGTGILRNKTNGGDGACGLVHSDETKRKISKIHKGKKLSEEHKQILAQHRITKHSEKTKEKIRQAKIGNTVNIGRKLTEEHKEKIRQGNIGKFVSDETKNKISNGKIGKNSILWKITFNNGETIERFGITNWAKENGYDTSSIHRVYNGKCKKHKDIIFVEKLI